MSERSSTIADNDSAEMRIRDQQMANGTDKVDEKRVEHV